MSKIAIIDIGTNTFHLMIVDLANHNKVMHKEKVAVRLGKDGISNNKITEDAQKRAINTLSLFKTTAEAHHVESIHATATSAVRNADNGQELVELVKEATGIEIAIISGAQEATYIYNGVKQALTIGKEPALVMDIGGGSVEFILCDQDNIFWLESFEIGAQRLLDKFHEHDPIQPKDIVRLKDFLDTSLKSLQEQLEKHQPKHLIGSSGTFDTLVDIAFAEQNKLKPDDPSFSLSIEEFNGIYHELIEKNRAERLEIPGMLEMRVDMIVVASCLIDYILKINDFDTIHVSTYSLKEGLLSEIMEQV
ncbi:hypothetical protein GCM10027429_10140 [Marivirga atlantica]|uniref:Exopolyphosphatase n=1 Tax=Marivirga atlantica TaxID=1548457 RepID=A0A937DDV9_9BACT|nr:exopolyphosphatase [Marivirga atlantica]MBL0764627.1 exopolyphosphatase [Marivirga atlantica]